MGGWDRAKAATDNWSSSLLGHVALILPSCLKKQSLKNPVMKPEKTGEQLGYILDESVALLTFGC